MKRKRISIRFDFLGLSLHSHNSISFHIKNFKYEILIHEQRKRRQKA